MKRAYFVPDKIFIRKVIVIIIFAFIGWISLFGEALQSEYQYITFWGLVIFLIISFLYKRLVRFSTKDLAFLIYVLILTIGLNFSEFKSSALERYTIIVIPVFLLYFSLCYQDMHFIYPVSLSIFLFSNLIVLIGILEALFGKNIIYELWVKNPFYCRFIHNTPRIMSTLTHPTVCGSFLLGCLPFAFFLASHTKTSYRIFVKMFIPIQILGIIFSFSRGNIAGLLVLGLVYLFLTKRTRYVKFILTGLLILVLLASTVLKRELGFFRLSLPGLFSQWWEAKIEMSNTTSKILKEHPFLGIGLNHFRLKFDKYSSENYKRIGKEIKKIGYDPYEWKTPDNMYLSILSETGLLGFLSFILFLFLLFKNGLGFIKATNDAKGRDFAATLMCGIVGLLISMSTYDLFYWINPLLLFWFLVGNLRAVLITDDKENNPMYFNRNLH